MAPKESQDAIKEYGRPEYEAWLKDFPHTQSLEPKAQVEAFRIWDQQVGAQKTRVALSVWAERDAPSTRSARGIATVGESRRRGRRRRHEMQRAVDGRPRFVTRRSTALIRQSPT